MKVDRPWWFTISPARTPWAPKIRQRGYGVESRDLMIHDAAILGSCPRVHNIEPYRAEARGHGAYCCISFSHPNILDFHFNGRSLPGPYLCANWGESLFECHVNLKE